MVRILTKGLLSLSFSHALRIPLSKLTMSTSVNSHKLVVDAFAIRQFNNPSYTGSQIHFPVDEFEKKVNEHFEAGAPLVDGYAPFWYGSFLYILDCLFPLLCILLCFPASTYLSPISLEWNVAM